MQCGLAIARPTMPCRQLCAELEQNGDGMSSPKERRATDGHDTPDRLEPKWLRTCFNNLISADRSETLTRDQAEEGKGRVELAALSLPRPSLGGRNPFA